MWVDELARRESLAMGSGVVGESRKCQLIFHNQKE